MSKEAARQAKSTAPKEDQKTPDTPPATTGKNQRTTSPPDDAIKMAGNQQKPTNNLIQDQEQQQAATTIKLKQATKSRLEILKGLLNQPDYDGVVTRLIDILPAKISTEQEIHLIMPISKYRWLMAHQDTCDCRNCLNDSRV
jgi:hypothetical protein